MGRKGKEIGNAFMDEPYGPRIWKQAGHIDLES